MPCDTIQTSSVDLTNPNITLLMEALHMKGLNPKLHDNNRITFSNGSYENGKLQMRGRNVDEDDAQEIKVAYSEKIVRYAAKQFGWKVETDVNAVRRKGVAMVLKIKK